MKEEKEAGLEYGEQKVHQMVQIRFRELRNGGILESLEDIFTKQPPSRIEKDNYIFSFDNVRNHTEDKINDKSKLQKILNNEMQLIRNIEIRGVKEVFFENEDELYSEKLKSGSPIFKSIIFLRYQDNQKWVEFFGEEHPFIVDQASIDFSQIKADIAKLRLFLQDGTAIPKMAMEFADQNTIELKYDRFPTMSEIERRADAMAKLLLYNVFSQEHRRLKQAWKNDENYQEMLKNERRLKADNEPEKQKEGDNQQEDQLLRMQVRKVLVGIEQKANYIANEQFKQLNGEKAVLTKKSLQKLKTAVAAQKNPRMQLAFLIAYKQKKSW